MKALPSLEEMLRISVQMGGPSEEAIHRMAAEMQGSKQGAAHPKRPRPRHAKRARRAKA
jgi:hypothetical protein